MLDTTNIEPPGTFPKGFTICPALKEEAPDLANLAVLASGGLSLATWEALREGDETAMEVGCQRAARIRGAFSYRNADIAMQERKVIAAIISYPIRPETFPVAPGDIPPVFRPLLALEIRATPSWYINILATYPEARGQGAATALMADVAGRAKSVGFRGLSLIVGDTNPARKLYETLGFHEVTRAATVKDGHDIPDAHWILMKKRIA